jgi:acetylornithine deacetylase/succinyl-diaminopimelate desuccinylase-like protein
MLVACPSKTATAVPDPVGDASRVSLREEVAGLLQALIRLNTVNPPGNETAAAELLRDHLVQAGAECELYARVPERANLVARIAGRGDGPALLFLAHTDTVPADPAEWSVDPWSGELRDGQIWGRGALDMKGHCAAAATAVARLARERFRPAGAVIFAACADEEVGEDFGLSWLCSEHPAAVRADYCVNEGGGDRVVVDGHAVYLCSTAEKMSSPFLLRVRGRSGHASMPGIADNALVKAAALVERLGRFQAKPRLLPETGAFFGALGSVPEEEAVRASLEALEPAVRGMVEPMLGLTVSPTMIKASRTRNVVPGVCEVVCDCRLLPGQSQTEAEEAIRGWLGPDGYELEWIEGVGGTRSALETPLWAAVDSFVRTEEAGALLAPIVLPGFTDSHWVREAFGTVSYGFFPMRTMGPELTARLIHSADERVAVDDLELGTRFLLHVVRTLGA